MLRSSKVWYYIKEVRTNKLRELEATDEPYFELVAIVFSIITVASSFIYLIQNKGHCCEWNYYTNRGI